MLGGKGLRISRVVRSVVCTRLSSRHFCDTRGQWSEETLFTKELQENLKAAEAGNVQAQLYLANYYSTGVETRKDTNKAVEWLQKAINAGSSVAKVVLASTWLNTVEHLDEDAKKTRINDGINLLNSAADQEDPIALQKLGNLHLEGILVPNDSQKAVHMLEKACQLGNSIAEYELGKLYINGSSEGVKQNVALGLTHLQTAMKAGDYKASEFFYDFLYQRSMKAGGEELQNYVNYLSRGAQSNDPMSLHFFGLFILKHYKEIGKEVQEAFELLNKASKKSFVPSHCVLGDLHRTGVISPGNPDYKAAFSYYKMAADQGYDGGYNGLGKCYLDGLGVRKDYGKAEELFRTSLASGNTIAHTQLGAMQYNGFGMKKNEKAALNHFHAAANVGDKEALYHLGVHFGNTGDIKKAVEYLDAASVAIPESGYTLALMFLSGLDTLEKDSSKGIEYLERSGSLGSGAAICKLGLLYFEGLGVDIPRDLEKAESYWKQGCELNYPQCFHNMGMIHMEKNNVTAAKFFQQASDRNVIESHEKLGTMLLHGNGIGQDVDRGIELLHKAGEAGNLFSLMKLGLTYSDDKLVPMDLERSIGYFLKASEHDPSVFHILGSLQRQRGNSSDSIDFFRKGAEAGHDLSQIELGYSYFSGNFVEKDLQSAAEWFGKAAEQQNTIALHNLGMMFMEGEHQKKDEIKGLEYITKAAELGNTTAQTNLGNLYWNGSETISSNVDNAKIWWEKASESQYPEAMYNLGELYMAGFTSIPQDTDKGLKLISAAAALGNQFAINRLARNKE